MEGCQESEDTKEEMEALKGIRCRRTCVECSTYSAAGVSYSVRARILCCALGIGLNVGWRFAGGFQPCPVKLPPPPVLFSRFDPSFSSGF